MDTELGENQLQFAELLWKRVPIASGETVVLCAERFGWKKPTTYTVLRKLCEKGLFSNTDGTVRAVVSREEYYAAKSDRFIRETFGGSLPSFIAAFTATRDLTEAEIRAIEDLMRQKGK